MSADAEFFEGRIDEAQGLVGWGCVYDMDGDFSQQNLPPGQDQVLAKLVVDVLVVSETDTVLSFEEVPVNVDPENPVRNVMTDTEGYSITPQVTDGTLSVMPGGGDGQFKRGDANDDGNADISDAQFILSYLFLGGTAPPCMEAANVDDSDSAAADITDAIYLLTFLFMGGSAPPAPGTACGVEPATSPSSLGCDSYTHCP
jgi:hypothetical protein